MTASESDWASTSFALLVGVGRYKDTEIEDLDGPESDVLAIRRVLIERCGFELKNVFVRVNEDATRNRVLEALEALAELAKNAPADARVLFYFSGHGDLDDDDKYLPTCLLPYDARKSQVAETGVQGTSLSKWLTKAGASRTMVVLDCCMAEGVNLELREPLTVTAGKGAVLGTLFASAAEEGAAAAQPDEENGSGEGLSWFTERLVGVLRSGEGALSFQDLIEGLCQNPEGDEQRVRPQVKGVASELEVRLAGRGGEFSDAGEAGCVLVVSETERERNKSAEGGVVQHVKDALSGPSDFDDRPLSVIHVDDAVQSHVAWSDVVQALCRARVAVFDVTAFEPAIMLLLGVRAAVRRGVTLLTTADDIRDGQTNALPFNLLGSRRFEHVARGEGQPDPVNRIESAIDTGLRELNELGEHYLDLPAYDAVRRLGRRPEDYETIPPTEMILGLRSFDQDYQKPDKGRSHATMVEIGIEKWFGRGVTVTLDSSSPRVVTQELYDLIRRCEVCVVDWTGWRANVFFELGVRLAVNESPALHLISDDQRDGMGNAGQGWSADEGVEAMQPERWIQLRGTARQRKGLIRLFAPFGYNRNGSRGKFEAVKRDHDARASERMPVEDGELRPGETFRLAQLYFDWSAEPRLAPIYEELRDEAKMMRGGKSETEGSETALYRGNDSYVSEIRSAAAERVLAAWFYVNGRYSAEQIDQREDLQVAWMELADGAAAILHPEGGAAEDLADSIDDLIHEHHDRRRALKTHLERVTNLRSGSAQDDDDQQKEDEAE